MDKIISVLIVLLIVLIIFYYKYYVMAPNTSKTTTSKVPPLKSLVEMNGIWKNLKVNSAGFLYGVGADNNSYNLDDSINPGFSGQNNVSDSSSSGKSLAFCYLDGRILYNNNIIQGSALQCEIGADETFMVVNQLNSLYLLTESGWQLINDNIKQVSVASGSYIVGVSSDGKLFKYSKNIWTNIAGSYKFACCGFDGSIWAIDANGNLLLYISDGQWHTVAPATNYVQVRALSKTQILTVDSNGKAYKNF